MSTRSIRWSVAAVLAVAVIAVAAPGGAVGSLKYTMLDLGTLGGGSSAAYHVNDAGQAAGWSYTAAGEYHGFFWDPATGMVDLTLGGVMSDALAMNEAGQVVGYSRTTSGAFHGFVWIPGSGITDVGTLPGAQNDHSDARDINNAGQAVGWSAGAGYAAPNHAYLWQANTGMVDLGTFSGYNTGAEHINEAGAVQGHWIAPGQPQADGVFFLSASGGVMVDVGNLGAGSRAFADAQDMNDAGEIVGMSAIPTGAHHAFAWAPGGDMVDLGTLGGVESQAMAINNAGRVVGWAETASGEKHPFVWDSAGGIADLGTFGGTISTANDINEEDQVVGCSPTAAGLLHAFVWDESGGMLDINPEGVSLSCAWDISEAGQVVGYARLAGTGTTIHAVMWTPIAIDDVLGEFDTAVAAGDLVAVGGQGNLVAFRNKLANIAKWLEGGNLGAACAALEEAQQRCDGLAQPKDWVTGTAVAMQRLATGIASLIAQNC